MELEQRVKALEQELAILKHQIQVTLLEVHEQVLAGRHPDLRADGAAASASVPSVVSPEVALSTEDNGGREPRSEKGGAGASKAEIPTAPSASEPPEPLTDLAADEAYLPKTAMPILAPAKADWSEVVSTINWLQESIEQVGIAHTRREIVLYVRDGVLPPEVEMPLLELLDLYEARDAFEADREHESSVTQVLVELINSRRAREGDFAAEVPDEADLMPLPPVGDGETVLVEESSEREQMRDIVQRLIYGLENLDAA